MRIVMVLLLAWVMDEVFGLVAPDATLALAPFFAVAAIALMVAGLGLSTYGAVAQAQAQKSQEDYAARVAKYKAQVAAQEQKWAQYQAKVAQGESAIKERRQKERTEAIIGAQVAAVGKSGVTGLSLLEAELDTAKKAMADLSIIKWQGETDYLTALFTGQRSAEQSQVYGSEEKFHYGAGRAASRLGAIGGSASLLSGLGETTITAGRIGMFKESFWKD